MGSSESLSMSSRQGGSRYPSAFGHTPTYRSYASIPDASVGDLTRDLTRDLGSLTNTAGVSAFNRTPTSLLTSTDFNMPAVGGSSSSSSAQKVASYSSSYSSTSRDGGRPVTEYSTDSTYKSTTTGPSGIPHTSYGHSSSNYSSENPYKNRVSSYSYNI